jgi:hypothetical protein
MPDRLNQVYQPELIFRVSVLLLAVTTMSLSFLMTIKDDQEVYLPLINQPLPEVCGSRSLLGVDCPGCGMSRAFISISNLEIGRALAFNSASLIVYLFVAIQIPWHAMQIFRTLYRGGPIDTWWTLFPLVGVIVWLLWCNCGIA